MNEKNAIKISGSLSCVDLLHLASEMRKINQSDLAYIHYDVVDGDFNDCFIFGDIILETIRPLTDKPIAVHLAVYQVEKYIKPMIDAGADYICVHYESNCNLIEIFSMIRKMGKKPVLAFRSETPVPNDFLELAGQVEWILKLIVNPGYAGQLIQRNALNHIREMKQLLLQANMNKAIEADGNINISTIPAVVASGATMLIGGSSGLFNKKGSIDDNFRKMLKVAIK